MKLNADFLVVLSSFFVSVNAFSQTQKTTPQLDKFKDINQVEEVLVLGNRILSPWGSDISQVSSTYSSTIKNVHAVHVNQLLSRAAGVWVSRGNGQEHLTAIRSPVLTGAGGCGAFFMAQDGISLRAPAFCNANQLFDANTVQAQRIDVLNGTASTLYGSNAVHGVINIITPTIGALPKAELSLEGGPNNFYRTAFILSQKQTPQVKNKHAFAAYGVLTSDGGYKDDSGYDQQKINLIHEYNTHTLSIKNHLALTNLNQETAGFVQGLNAFSDPALKRANPNPEAYRDAKSARAYSVIHAQTQNGTLTLKPYLRYNTMTFLQHFLPWQAIESNSHKSVGLQGDYAFNKNNFFITVGADIDATQGELDEFQPNDFSPTIPQGAHYDYTVNTLTLSPFAHAKWQANPQLSLHTGLRFDTAGFDYTNHLSVGDACEAGVENCRFTRPSDTQERFNYASTQIGFNYQLNTATTFFGRIANGFRAPQATELFRLQAGQTITNLQPEQATTYELGIRGGKKMSYQVALFHLLKKDVLFQDANRNNINGGETQHTGIELTASVPLNKQWSFNINGTYAEHTYKSDFLIANTPIMNNEIDTAPRRLGSAQLKWQGKKTNAELEWVNQGGYFLNPTNTARYNGHNVLNVRARYTINPKLNVGIRITNLANKDYAERADFGFGNYRYFVGEPRSVFLSGQFRL